MSIRSECFDNVTGKCGRDCSLYIEGECDVNEDIVSIFHRHCDEIEQHRINKPKWQPTPDEIREFCGVWALDNGFSWIVTTEMLLDFNSKSHFMSTVKNSEVLKIEPIPEQCIPKPEVELERYEWAGIIDEWM